jgi:hypothetical protein
MPAWPGFVGGAGVAQSVIADAEDTINLYVETLDNGASGLFSVPGYQRWTDLSFVADVGARAALVANGRLFWVIGASLWEFDANGTPTKRNVAALAVDGNPAQLIYNGVVGDQLGLVSGGSVYSFNLTTNVLSAALLSGGYTHLTYAAGFGLALNPTTGKVNVSAANDLSTWSAGTFFRRSLLSDPYQAMFTDANNLVWLPGTDTFEVRYLGNPTADQPFTPLSGLTGGFGIAAPFAFASSLQTGTADYWLSRNPGGIGLLVSTEGGQAAPVSRYAFNTAVAGYLRNSRINDAEIIPYQQEGHAFINVAFPSAQAATPTTPTTWSLDAGGKSWAKRGRWNGKAWNLWSPRVHVFAFNKHLVGDRTTGVIYEMDTSIATEIDGSGIVRERTAPGITDEHKRRPLDQIEILADVGVGTATGAGVDPIAVLRVSENGGKTYGNELNASMGRIGQYGQRLTWGPLGSPAHPVIRVRVTEPVPVRFMAAWINNRES